MLISNDFSLELPLKPLLEAAGFRLESIEAERSVIYVLGPDSRIIYCNKAWDEFASLNGGVGLNREASLEKFILNAIAEPLRSFYANVFAQAQKHLQPWEHDYECSSPALLRLFHMRVLPLANSYFAR